MIGIYKITNELCGKSYIGQSVRCGKRWEEHLKGDLLIDQVIQIEGIENFTFKILKECDEEELSYWEDYYITEYNTMFPNGYNKKWNCSRGRRPEITTLAFTENVINKGKKQEKAYSISKIPFEDLLK